MENFSDVSNEEDPRKIMNECLRVIWMFAASAADSQKTYQNLLTESEQRMMKTNEMIGSLSNLMHELKNTYEKHIDQACKSRDDLEEQNAVLIKQITRMEDELERERALNHDIIHHLFRSNTPIQNFNMEQK